MPILRPKSQDNKLLTIRELSKLHNASEKTIRRRIAAGELPVVRDGRLVRVRPVDYEAYLACRRN